MSEPTVVGCSWLSERELAGRGRMVFIDGGTLDFGIIRDSTLNARNDFQIFGETFKNVAPFVATITGTITTAEYRQLMGFGDGE